MQDEVVSGVYDILASNYLVDANTLQASQLVRDLDLDSIELVQLGMDLEDKFGVEIQDGDIRATSTIEDVIGLIRRLLP